MSYAIYVGAALSQTGHGWIAGYGDEPSSHWLEIVPAAHYNPGATITVGVGPEADLPGRRTEIPQAPVTQRHIRVSYSYYKGVPAPITNGGLNAAGVAVRDIWSPSRAELVAMTPKDQTGPNYSDLARIALERAETACHAVEICAGLIADHGESSYGGNSHFFADGQEAWVMIQFAGGQGLWTAERIGPDAVRASRPGYILEVPVDDPGHPDFLWSPNFVSFARDMGWYAGGPFDANAIYGDGKGRWAGVTWIEDEMRARAARGIGLSDMSWAIRTARLTGDRAGYGQVVPLTGNTEDPGQMLWHAPIGAVAAPFAPVFMAQDTVPPEFARHRYLTTDEAWKVLDPMPIDKGEPEQVSDVSQAVEAVPSAVYACKRLLYLMRLAPDGALDRVTRAFEAREARLAGLVADAQLAARLMAGAGAQAAAARLLDHFSGSELRSGLRLVTDLSAGLEAELRAGGEMPDPPVPLNFDQLW